MNISCTVICPLNLVQLRCIKTMLVDLCFVMPVIVWRIHQIVSSAPFSWYTILNFKWSEI